MEVKDLIKDQLTEQEEKQKELDERKEKYKKTQKFLVTDECEEVCTTLFEKWDKVLEEIKTELKNRKECKSKFSEVDKIVQDIEFYETVSKELWNSEWEKVLKNEFKIRIENAESNVFIKVSVEEMFDFAIYTELDMLKMKRNRLSTVKQYLTNLSESFFDDKSKEVPDNPYEEAPEWMSKEEFDASTDTK